MKTKQDATLKTLNKSQQKRPDPSPVSHFNKTSDLVSLSKSTKPVSKTLMQSSGLEKNFMSEADPHGAAKHMAEPAQYASQPSQISRSNFQPKKVANAEANPAVDFEAFRKTKNHVMVADFIPETADRPLAMAPSSTKTPSKSPQRTTLPVSLPKAPSPVASAKQVGAGVKSSRQTSKDLPLSSADVMAGFMSEKRTINVYSFRDIEKSQRDLSIGKDRNASKGRKDLADIKLGKGTGADKGQGAMNLPLKGTGLFSKKMDGLGEKKPVTTSKEELKPKANGVRSQSPGRMSDLSKLTLKLEAQHEAKSNPSSGRDATLRQSDLSGLSPDLKAKLGRPEELETDEQVISRLRRKSPMPSNGRDPVKLKSGQSPAKSSPIKPEEDKPQPKSVKAKQSESAEVKPTPQTRDHQVVLPLDSSLGHGSQRSLSDADRRCESPASRVAVMGSSGQSSYTSQLSSPHLMSPTSKGSKGGVLDSGFLLKVTAVTDPAPVPPPAASPSFNNCNGKDAVPDDPRSFLEYLAQAAQKVPKVTKAYVEFDVGRSIVALGYNTHVGKSREKNEDEITITAAPALLQSRRLKSFSPEPLHTFGMFSIFDGHGGYECSRFLKNTLHDCLLDEAFLSRKDFAKRLRVIYKKVEGQFRTKAVETGAMLAGSCAVTLVVANSTLISINVGDSRIVLSMKNGRESINMTTDHKPDAKTEFDRILSTGARVYRNTFNKRTRASIDEVAYKFADIDRFESTTRGFSHIETGPWRIHPGSLSVSRTIGDFEAKLGMWDEEIGAVVNEPEVREIDVGQVDFAVIGCDGVFDELTSGQVVETVWKTIEGMKGEGTRREAVVSECVNNLIVRSMVANSLDNLSVVLVFFKSLF